MKTAIGVCLVWIVRVSFSEHNREHGCGSLLRVSDSVEFSEKLWYGFSKVKLKKRTVKENCYDHKIYKWKSD